MRRLFLVLGVPIRKKLLETDIGQRVLDHLLENGEGHGTDVTAGQRGFDDMLGMPHARHEHVRFEIIIFVYGHDLPYQLHAV